MALEIVSGYLFGSMALLADGWHMCTHAVALGIALFTYSYARRHADNPLFSFGTGKVGVLGGFASSIILGGVAIFMAIESIKRFVSPEAILYNEAIIVATIGLVVNLVCAVILKEDHHHHEGDDIHHRHDHNIKAAYLHVLADALTSLLAIAALLAAKELNWVWMDPLVGCAGAVVISKWAYGLMRDTAKILLDSGVESGVLEKIKNIIESDSDSIILDLHVWRLGSDSLSVIISLSTHNPRPPEHYKKLLEEMEGVKHITVEVDSVTGKATEK